MTFETAADRDRETAVRDRLAAAWGVDVYSFGSNAPVDVYLAKRGQLVGVAEIKCRGNTHDRYPTTFLTMRKWVSLTMTAFGLCVPAFYVLAWADGVVGWIGVDEVDATQHRIGGRREPRAPNDVEPVIDIPSAAFKILG